MINITFVLNIKSKPLKTRIYFIWIKKDSYIITTYCFGHSYSRLALIWIYLPRTIMKEAFWLWAIFFQDIVFCFRRHILFKGTLRVPNCFIINRPAYLLHKWTVICQNHWATQIIKYWIRCWKFVTVMMQMILVMPRVKILK